LYKKFWQGVFADLQMAPLEGSESKSQDYISAINYRISLFYALVGHDKRRKAGTNISYSLPLRQFYFKPFDSIWHYYGDDVDDGSRAQTEFISPFSILIGGTGQEYVFVDPDLGSVDVHSSILERVQCLDKSIQKKRESAQRAVGSARLRLKPIQTLLRSCRDSIKEGAGLLNWEEYFGNDTPFGPYDVLPPEFSRRIYVEEVSLKALDSMEKDGVHLIEKIIIFSRLVRDQDGRKCTEFILWGDSGHEERSPSKRFIQKTILRVPAGVIEEFMTIEFDKVYMQLTEGDPYGNSEVDTDKVYYQYSLPNIEDGQQYYVQPEFYFSAENKVLVILTMAHNQVLVGTDVGTIECWDCSDKSAPNRIKTLHASNAFPFNTEKNGIGNLIIVDEVRENFFISSQRSSMTGVITLWQSPHQSGVLEDANFQMMVKIKYEYYINFMCSGYSLMVLCIDKFGSLYLDVYHLLGTRYILNKFDHVNLPKGIEITPIHPKGEQQIQFANRINLRHRVGSDETGMAEQFVMDFNDRFLIIEAHGGLVGSNGESKSDGPGLIVIDLDEHASGIPSYP